jgi:hypothetical protein
LIPPAALLEEVEAVEGVVAELEPELLEEPQPAISSRAAQARGMGTARLMGRWSFLCKFV